MKDSLQQSGKVRVDNNFWKISLSGSRSEKMLFLRKIGGTLSESGLPQYRILKIEQVLKYHHQLNQILSGQTSF